VANKRKATRKSSANHSSGGLRAEHDVRYDVVIVGAGPAGSTLAWKLALEGLKTIVLDGARFPREKVCGDYIEPRGLHILDLMGCLETMEATSPLPITYSSTYVDGRRCYIGRIPFYGVHKHLPKHGYIVPRDVLDNVILQSAVKAGATAHQETYVTDFSANRTGVTLQASRHGERVVYRGRIIVGADGVNSIVARGAGLLADDPRYIALSQRAYADGHEGEIGEAAFFFDADFFPGYGWMFPMSQGRVNLGVGVLKETCQRNGIAVPQLFRDFFEKLRRSHPRCRKLKLVRPPIGGIVKTYGGSGPNYFNNGLLIGDAGCFVDPMTGEGITPAMESALIAARIIMDVLPRGHLGAKSLSAYENEFRKYFDPSMIFVDLCAAILRNPHYWGSWKRALERGCAFAQKDSKFAATSAACFGGLEVNPSGILAEMWVKTAESLLGIGLKSMLEIADGRVNSVALSLQEMAGFMNNSCVSLLNDPFWHVGWTMDVQRKSIRALSIVSKRLQDPRIKGVV
jgi:geranylgeranyl reductase family protein